MPKPNIALAFDLLIYRLNNLRKGGKLETHLLPGSHQRRKNEGMGSIRTLGPGMMTRIRKEKEIRRKGKDEIAEDRMIN